MNRIKNIPIPNLSEITFAQALDLAYQTCKFTTGKTHEDIAEEMGKGVETIRRYFTDPTYNPPTRLLPKLSKVIGNTILIDWLCINANGHFCQHTDKSNKPLEALIAELTKEFSDVLREDSKAMVNRNYEMKELIAIEKELNELIKKAEEIIYLIKESKENARRENTQRNK